MEKTGKNEERDERMDDHNLDLVDSTEVERIECEEVTSEEVPHIMNIIVPQMRGIRDANNGIGLAAPQVGIKKKFSCYKDPDTGEEKVIFNAWYVKNSDTRTKMNEGCLSYPGKELKKPIKRYKSVKLIYDEWDEESQQLISKRRTVKGLEAVVVQHECDHLRGVTIFTRGSK